MNVFVLVLSLVLCSSAAGKEHHVYPIILETRSTASKLVLRINDKITLNLEKSEVLAEELHFVTATTERHEVETVNTSSIEENIYHDSTERSSLMLHRKYGTLYVGRCNRHIGGGDRLQRTLDDILITLRYLEMEMPSITFKIVGVTMSRADIFASHILGTIEAYETLNKLEKYYREGNIPGNPDVVFLITNRDMSTVRGGSLDKDIAGLANVAGVCTTHRVAMGEDIAPSFDGAFAMAHEIGHSLGARHDPRGSGECAWRRGFLMSYEDGGPNKYRLSECSMDAIRTNTEKLPGGCLSESAARMHYIVKSSVMPGQKISASYYCSLIMKRTLIEKRIRSDVSPQTPLELTKQCKMKCCYSVNHQTWCRKVDLLDGMECEEESTCRKGVCMVHKWAEK
uniref:Reprolysin n=1 Tax=Rhipicephalus zambeziensis TaxID=60191 RepID=A0A224YP99_9ACAR